MTSQRGAPDAPKESAAPEAAVRNDPFVSVEDFGSAHLDRGIELVGAWAAEEAQHGHYADTAAHFEERLEAFAQRPV